MRMGQIIMVLAALAASSHAYTMIYYDCGKPQSINEYDLKTYYVNEKTISGETTTYHVLQKRKNIKMNRYSCQIIISTFIFHCGMFSHHEVIKMPDIEIKQIVSIQNAKL